LVYPVDLNLIQHELGKLIEAVGTLKEQSRDHDIKLNDVCLDVHGVKSAGKALRWAASIVSGIIGAVAAIILTEYFHHVFNVAK